MAIVLDRIHYTKWTESTGKARYGCEIFAREGQRLRRPKSDENGNAQLVDRGDENPF